MWFEKIASLHRGRGRGREIYFGARALSLPSGRPAARLPGDGGGRQPEDRGPEGGSDRVQQQVLEATSRQRAQLPRASSAPPPPAGLEGSGPRSPALEPGAGFAAGLRENSLGEPASEKPLRASVSSCDTATASCRCGAAERAERTPGRGLEPRPAHQHPPGLPRDPKERPPPLPGSKGLPEARRPGHRRLS